jgi:hypothetical protein
MRAALRAANFFVRDRPPRIAAPNTPNRISNSKKGKPLAVPTTENNIRFGEECIAFLAPGLWYQKNEPRRFWSAPTWDTPATQL